MILHTLTREKFEPLSAAEDIQMNQEESHEQDDKTTI